MFNFIRKLLQEKEYNPDAILDIGAHHGNWTIEMKQIYNNCKYFLFEGIDYIELNKFQVYDDIKVFNVILNEKEEDVIWYEMRNTGDSMFKENTHHFINCEGIKRKSIDLDSLNLQQNLFQDFKNILIKIDCQGAEIPILKGCSTILHKTDFIILEIPLFGQYNEGVPNFLEHIQYMDSINFIPYGVIDTHYSNGFNNQIDMIFINKSHEFNKITYLLHP
jgi:FkbM family methyltransferase